MWNGLRASFARFVNACESEGDWPFSPSKDNVGQHAPVRERQKRKSLVGTRVFTVHLGTVPQNHQIHLQIG